MKHRQSEKDTLPEVCFIAGTCSILMVNFQSGFFSRHFTFWERNPLAHSFLVLIPMNLYMAHVFLDEYN